MPRQSGRNRWREKSGFAPNMLPEAPSSGILLKGDLLIYCDIEDYVDYYAVEKDFKLLNLETKVEVVKVGTMAVKHVRVDRFLTQKGMVFTVPSTMYSISADNSVIFKDEEITDFVESQKAVNNCDNDDDGGGGGGGGDESDDGDHFESDIVDFATAVEGDKSDHSERTSPKQSAKRKLDGTEGESRNGKERRKELVDRGNRVPLMRGDCVKIIAGLKIGQYALITEGGRRKDKFDCNYFTKKYGKYVLNKEGAIESREACELQRVEFEFDSRSRYTFDV